MRSLVKWKVEVGSGMDISQKETVGDDGVRGGWTV